MILLCSKRTFSMFSNFSAKSSSNPVNRFLDISNSYCERVGFIRNEREWEKNIIFFSFLLLLSLLSNDVENAFIIFDYFTISLLIWLTLLTCLCHAFIPLDFSENRWKKFDTDRKLKIFLLTVSMDSGEFFIWTVRIFNI